MEMLSQAEAGRREKEYILAKLRDRGSCVDGEGVWRTWRDIYTDQALARNLREKYRKSEDDVFACFANLRMEVEADYECVFYPASIVLAIGLGLALFSLPGSGVKLVGTLLAFVSSMVIGHAIKVYVSNLAALVRLGAWLNQF